MFVPTLESVRLRLRQYRPDDFSHFAALNSDVEVRRHVGGPLSESRIVQYMDGFTSASETTGMRAWAVEGSRSGRYIGHAWLLYQGKAYQPDVGILISHSQWGNRYGSEAIAEICKFARRALGCNEIYASVDTENLRSQAMLRRAGLKYITTENDEDGSYLIFAGDGAQHLAQA